MNQPPLKLRFFVLGAQKCATSWLSYCLRDHPAIRLPDKKIEHAYIGGRMFLEKGEDWYYSRFRQDDPDAVYGEVAVDYLLDSSVPKILPRYADDPRFVVMIRHPVDRLVSAYYWSVRRSQLPEVRIEEAIAPLLADEPGFPTRYENRYFDELVRRGFYGRQLEPYLKAFGPERFLVISYDEVKADPARVVQRVFRHIGVRDDFEPASLNVTPKQNSYNRYAMRFERLSTHINFSRIADRMNRLLARVSKPDSGLTATSRARLREQFQPHIDQTEEVIQVIAPSNRPGISLQELWL